MMIIYLMGFGENKLKYIMATITLVFMIINTIYIIFYCLINTSSPHAIRAQK